MQDNFGSGNTRVGNESNWESSRFRINAFTPVLSLNKPFGIPSRSVFPHIILISAACISLVSTIFITQHLDSLLNTLS